MNKQEILREKYIGFVVDVIHNYGEEGKGLIIKEENKYYLVDDFSKKNGNEPNNKYGYLYNRGISSEKLQGVKIKELTNVSLAKNWAINISKEEYDKYNKEYGKIFTDWYNSILKTNYVFTFGIWSCKGQNTLKGEDYVYTFEQWIWWWGNYGKFEGQENINKPIIEEQTLPDRFLLYPIYKKDIDKLIEFNDEFSKYGIGKCGIKQYKNHCIYIVNGKDLESYGQKQFFLVKETISSTKYLEIVNNIKTPSVETINNGNSITLKTEEQYIEQINILEKRIERSLEVFREQDEKIKRLEKIDVEKEKKQAVDEYIKGLLVKKIPTEKLKKHKAWDDIIIEDLVYKKLLLAWDKRLPMLLNGPAGCGKSSIIKALAEEKESRLIQYNFNGETTVEHLLGHKILINGTMSWEDGPLTDAVRNGYTFLADEINATSPEVQYILNGLLENKKGELGSLSIQGNNGEVIKAHPNFRFFGTYNPNYLGTNHFSLSIMSRFIGANISPLGEEDEKSLLIKFFPTLGIEIGIIVEKAGKLRRNRDFNYDLSTRDLIQALYFIEGGFSIIEAVEATIISSLQIDLEKTICREVFES